jgi:aspartate aminotransferase
VSKASIHWAQLATGFSFPNALLQHAIEDLEGLSIDVAALERRRDRLVGALRGMGYDTTLPEGTFYVLARSPIDDDVAFAELLAEEHILTLPGSIVEVPGWFRISLTASDEMVESSLARFGRARARADTNPIGGSAGDVAGSGSLGRVQLSPRSDESTSGPET